MNLYEHTIIARQDVCPTQLKQIQDKYTKIIEDNDGNILKFETWGLMHLSYLIKKNKKGNYLHFKIEGSGKTIRELEKNEKIEITITAINTDLKTKFFLSSIAKKISFDISEIVIIIFLLSYVETNEDVCIIKLLLMFSFSTKNLFS